MRRLIFNVFCSPLGKFLDPPDFDEPLGKLFLLIQLIYNFDNSTALYVDGVLQGVDTQPLMLGYAIVRSEKIFLGKGTGDDNSYGKLTVDWLTIWDRALTEDERHLVHLD